MKLTRFTLGVVGVFVAILIGSLGQHIGRSVADAVFGKRRPPARQEQPAFSNRQDATEVPLGTLLAQAADQVNRQLAAHPVTAGPLTTQQAVVEPGDRFVYQFAASGVPRPTDDYMKQMVAQRRPGVCSNSLRTLLDRGATLVYRISDVQNEWTVEATITAADCAAQ